MNIGRVLKSIGTAALLSSSACSGTYKQNLDFNPTEPLRVAVLPFVMVDDKGAIVPEESRLIVDNVSLISKKQEETPPQIVRRAALTELQKTNLDLVATALIDLDLPHHGYLTPDNKLDMKRIYDTKPADFCDKFLNCDAVLYGKVTRWDRSYYGLQTVNAVAVELKLVRARDGKVLYSATGEDTDNRGLSKGPTGWSSLVLEPIKGLDSEIIAELSHQVITKLVSPLNVKQRPVFLEAPPPAIIAVSHDAPEGRLSRTTPLVVVMYGSDGQLASFSIGESVQRVPMVERSPGHYYGEYIPLENDSFSGQPVKVFLMDKYGRTTERSISAPGVTLAGGSEKGRS
ncbi:MAG: DUF799 family lipoprotein [Bdellovibrionota bacterium]